MGHVRLTRHPIVSFRYLSGLVVYLVASGGKVLALLLPRVELFHEPTPPIFVGAERLGPQLFHDVQVLGQLPLQARVDLEMQA